MEIHIPGQFMPPNIGDKIVDLNLLVRAGGVNGKRVLNQGPSFPIDEILLGPYAQSWTAVDSDLSIIKRSELLGLHPKINFVYDSIVKMPEEWSQSFDLVINFSTLDNIEPEFHSRCFAEIGRVLVSGGTFIMTYGNEATFPEKIVRSNNWIEYRFNEGEISEHCVQNKMKALWFDSSRDRASVIAMKTE